MTIGDFCEGDFPENVKCAVFVWENGSKIQSTKPSAVNVDSSHAYWEEALQQVTVP